MNTESISATVTVPAPAGAVFAVLIDPRRHAGIDSTGTVTAAVDVRPLTAVGDLFTMAMHHPDHPDGAYETVNEVIALEPGRVVAWRTGYVADESGRLEFGGWWWRYDLLPLAADQTEVTLTHDWSEVGPGPREHLDFPIFADGHLEDSLCRLTELVAAGCPRPSRR